MCSIVFIAAAILAVTCRAWAQDEEDVLIKGQGTVRFENKEESPFAKFGALDGDVMFKRYGGLVWERAVQDGALKPGDTVITLANSSADIEFRSSSSIRLGSMSQIAIDEVLDPAGFSDVAVAVTKGKMWSNVNSGNSKQRTIISAANSIIDTSRGKSFIEMGDAKSVCLDIFSGAVNVRSTLSPSHTQEVGPGERYSVDPFAVSGDTGEFHGDFNEFNSGYSCMAATGNAQEQIIAVSTGDSGAEENTYIITGGDSVVFASGTQELTPVGNQEGNAPSLVFDAEDSTPKEAVPDESQYQDVVISGHGSIVFQNPVVATQPAEPATPAVTQPEEPGITKGVEPVACTTLPEISGVAVDGRHVSSGNSGETVEVTSATCAPVSIAISGSVDAKCGALKKLTVTAGGKPLAAAAQPQWSAVLNPAGAGTYNVEIKAQDSAGNQSETFGFVLSFVRDEPAPVVKLETIGGADAANAFSGISLNRDNLENGKMVITGSADSQGCDIKLAEVSVNNGSTWAPAQGTQAWRYEFTPSAGTYNVLARTKDLLNKQSEAAFQAVEVAYSPRTEDDNLRDVFNTMMKAYRDKSSSTFMQYVAGNYSSNYESITDTNSLENSLNNKFAAFPVISLKFKIDSVTISGNDGRVSFFWDNDPNSTSFSNNGTFVYTKDTSWKFVTVVDEQTFLRYTSIAGSIVMSAGKTALIANERDNTTVTAVVRDSARNLLRDGSVVNFTASTGSLSQTSAVTVGGSATVTYTAGAILGVTTINAASGPASSSIDLTLQPESAPPPPPH